MASRRLSNERECSGTCLISNVVDPFEGSWILAGTLNVSVRIEAVKKNLN